MTDSTEVRAPAEAREKFIEDLVTEGKSEGTIRAYSSILDFFVTFCDLRGIDDLEELNGNHLRKWKHWRRSRGNDLDDNERLSPKTLKDDMYMTRAFIRWVAQMGVLPYRMVESVRIPETETEDEVRFEHLDKEVAERIIEYFEAAAPGSLHHALMLLGWHTAMRLCSIHSIDLRDIDDEEYSIKLRHRPDTGTVLKDGTESEHKVAIAPEVMEVLERYIEYHRPDVEDEHGREPLFASNQGRRSKSNLREYVYEATQPCQIGMECPHEKDPRACDAAIRRNDASKCPSSVSPHAIRKGAITNWCDEDVPRRKISGRADVTRDVIEKHYDQRSETDRMEQ